MPLVGPSDFLRGKRFGSGHTLTAMFPLAEIDVAAIGFGCQEWKHVRADLRWVLRA